MMNQELKAQKLTKITSLCLNNTSKVQKRGFQDTDGFWYPLLKLPMPSESLWL